MNWEASSWTANFWHSDGLPCACTNVHTFIVFIILLCIKLGTQNDCECWSNQFWYLFLYLLLSGFQRWDHICLPSTESYLSSRQTSGPCKEEASYSSVWQGQNCIWRYISSIQIRVSRYTRKVLWYISSIQIPGPCKKRSNMFLFVSNFQSIYCIVYSFYCVTCKA